MCSQAMLLLVSGSWSCSTNQMDGHSLKRYIHAIVSAPVGGVFHMYVYKYMSFEDSKGLILIPILDLWVRYLGIFPCQVPRKFAPVVLSSSWGKGYPLNCLAQLNFLPTYVRGALPQHQVKVVSMVLPRQW